MTLDYHPRSLNLTEFVKPEMSPLAILGYFFIPVIGVIYGSYQFSGLKRFGLERKERYSFVWFLMCGLIHCVLEGFYVANHNVIQGTKGLLADIWKEYAKSDSRYLTRDPNVLAIEILTAAVIGPLCFICAWYILKRKSRQYTLQMFISTSQLYGVLIYYMGAGFDEFIYCSPKPLHFWGYFFGTNAFWVVMPIIMLRNAAAAINSRFQKIKSN